MNDSRGPWYLLTGVMIGLAAGVLWGWYVAPVTYTDTPPSSLRADYQDEYRTLIALAYAYNGDPGRAQSRLALLEDPAASESLAALAQRANALGRPSHEVQAISQLAVVAAGPPSGVPTAVPLTVFPTVMPAAATDTPDGPDQPVPTEPAATDTPDSPDQPVPTETAATDTPDSPDQPVPTETAVPLPTATPFPSATPQPTQGSPFILDSRILTCASPGDPLLAVHTLDGGGSGVPGVEIILTWPGNEEHIFTGLKPELGPGFADFEMTAGTVYTLRLADGSQLITDIQPEQCQATNGQQAWGVLELTFVQP